MQDTTANGNPIGSTPAPTPAPTPEPQAFAQPFESFGAKFNQRVKGDDEGLFAQIQQLNDELHRRRASELHLIQWRDQALPKMAEQDKLIETLKAENKHKDSALKTAIKAMEHIAAAGSKAQDELNQMRARLSAVVKAAAGL